MNDELISRKAVIDRLQKAQNVFLKQSPLEACGISYAREIIASEVEIPTIENRPQGEWIPKQLWDNTHIWVCSECGNQNTHGITVEKSCWKCGAKMKGGAE